MDGGRAFPVSVTQGAETSVSSWTAETVDTLKREELQAFTLAVDTFGKLSAVAQSLPAPVTECVRLRASRHTLYLACKREPGSSNVRILGGLKTGRKQLFIVHQAAYHQLELVCVLDFYVHESVQRQGVGLQLFQAFLQQENCLPEGLGYDRPSPKLLGFLAKHFGLHDYVPQNNKYVVFDSFWAQEPSRIARPASASSRLSRIKRQSADEQASPNFATLPLGSCAVHKPGPLPPSPAQGRLRPGAAAAAAVAKLGSRPHTSPAQWQIPAASSPQSGSMAQDGPAADRKPEQRSRSTSGEPQPADRAQAQWSPSRPPWALHLPPKQRLPGGR